MIPDDLPDRVLEALMRSTVNTRASKLVTQILASNTGTVGIARMALRTERRLTMEYVKRHLGALWANDPFAAPLVEEALDALIKKEA